eukprot:CAMPEP_0172569898 /NCGR_PEP_ID=MMETSP1067-20121228/125432_1 /TAXON_ID=265564 ORGANISM="Thalassiosira punctigera, Strain Tpunct2005C2" /NCGR_SAMPLE_ID=MMETSP1067 /ASSEMBLY_ACC=CAM_ASM_000444 /LENGTH=43 /DNA_ID= /DNA_START= /DNA_END= /DNA_ORIENTATION=
MTDSFGTARHVNEAIRANWQREKADGAVSTMAALGLLEQQLLA